MVAMMADIVLVLVLVLVFAKTKAKAVVKGLVGVVGAKLVLALVRVFVLLFVAGGDAAHRDHHRDLVRHWSTRTVGVPLHDLRHYLIITSH